MTWTLFALPAALLALGLPVFALLLAASALTLALFTTIPLGAVHQNLFAALTPSGMLAIPFFILAGEIMSRGTISLRLVDFVRALAGGAPGSLGVTTVGTATVFGAISGSSAAAVASVGRVMHPQMTRDGYPHHFSAGMVTSVSAIGIVIPPSIPMIVYGAASETSIPRLYAAGVVPGLLLAGMLAGYVMLAARRGGFGTRTPFRARAAASAARRAAWALGAPAVVLGGIYGGVFSPTEAAAVACAYAILVTRFALRELSWADILDCARATTLFSAQILVIVAAAGLFAWVLTVAQIPQAMVAWITAQDIAAWQFLIAVNVLLLLLGCVMDPLSAILLLTPVLIPVVEVLGIDKVHFGIVMTLNLAIGLFTPPFGINIFVAQSALGLPAAAIYRGVWPFLAVFLAALILITFVPALSLAGMEWLMRD